MCYCNTGFAGDNCERIGGSVQICGWSLADTQSLHGVSWLDGCQRLYVAAVLVCWGVKPSGPHRPTPHSSQHCMFACVVQLAGEPLRQIFHSRVPPRPSPCISGALQMPACQMPVALSAVATAIVRPPPAAVCANLGLWVSGVRQTCVPQAAADTARAHLASAHAILDTVEGTALFLVGWIGDGGCGCGQ